MTENVRDDFHRTVGSGSPGSLGTASPLGGPWSVAVSAALVSWSCDGDRARSDFAAGTGGSGNALLASATPVLEAHGAMGWRANVDGIGTATALWFRANGPAATFAGYGVRIFRPAGGTLCTMELLRGASDAAVVIATSASFPWPGAYTSYIRMELELVGVSPTLVRARWYPYATPPTDDSGWLQVSDAAGVQAAGAFGMRFSRSGTGNTVVGAIIASELYVAERLVPAYTTTFGPDGLSAIFDSSTLTTGDPVAHSWSFGDGSPAVTLANPTHVYAAAGTYSVAYTATTRWGTRRTSTQSVVVPGAVGLPVPGLKPAIYVNGEDICDRVFACDWSAGRERWPDDTTGGAVTLSIRGRMADAINGSPVVIAVPPGAPDGGRVLFTGEVDAIVESLDPIDAKTTTTITAMDVLAFLGRWHILPGTSMPAGPLTTRVASLAPRGTTVYRQKWAGVVAGRWPTLKSLASTADKLRDKTYLDVLRDGLRGSLATAYCAPDGAVVYAPLDPPAGVTPVVLDLDETGPDCPDHVDVGRVTAEGMLNRWTVGDGSVVDRVERQSIEAYGESPWRVSDGVLSSASTFPITDAIAEVMREPFAARTVVIPIRDWSARSYLTQPLEAASMDGVLYAVLGVRQRIGLDSWTVELSLDRDPWSMAGALPPVTPPAARTTTQTFLCDIDALLASPNMGAGKSTRLPVGLYSGTKFRALVRFNLAWAHTPKKVVEADLELDTASQDSVAYGANPRVIVDRITGSWSEGGSGGDGPPWTFNTSNAVVYPGPAVTSAGRVTLNVNSGQNVALNDIGLTEITRAWADGAANRGIRIMSADEGSTSRTTEFYSSEYSGSSTRRPRLRVTYEY